MPNGRQGDHFGRGLFRVEISGVTAAAFSAVDGLELRTDVIQFANGDNTQIRKRPGRTHCANIVLRRGRLQSSELWQWYTRVIAGQVDRRSGSIILLDDDMNEVLRYNFFEGWPCRWKSFALDANSDGALVEELEIAVEAIEQA